MGKESVAAVRLRQRTKCIALATASSLALVCAATPLHAQAVDQDVSDPTTAPQALDEIVVTATKRGEAENVQEVPVAISAFGSRQLEALNFRSLESLSNSIPNVRLDSQGSSAGFANFSIRGLGIASSIPSIDPTVGVFVDGVYLGITAGVVFENFDLDGIEVLRGPQGILFGKNVTGGAVVVRTKIPSYKFGTEARLSVETGLLTTLDGSVTGTLIPGRVAAKLALYHSNDDGWFLNMLDDRSFGRSRQTILRPAILVDLSENLSLIARYEHGTASGQGAATQSHALFDRKTFDISINNLGFYDSTWNQETLEANYKVGLGDGTITNIAGWRDYQTLNSSDIDGTPLTAFHNLIGTRQNQFSNELRYAGGFGAFRPTAGVYYFTQFINYSEGRTLAAGAPVSGGGTQKQHTFGTFAAFDLQLSERLTVNGGVRYTRERKRVTVSRLRPGGCIVETGDCQATFAGVNTSNNLSPKLGVQFRPFPSSQLYASYAKGFRGGGFNLRQTLDTVPPGPFGDERQDSFELGMKVESTDRRIRVNAAAFYNRINDVQREVILPSPLGVSQVIVNAANVDVRGAEAEGAFQATESILFTAQAGYVNSRYRRVTFDLSGDGRIDSADFRLRLPRLSPWTYGAAISYTLRRAGRKLAAGRVAFNHQDTAFYNDANTGVLNGADMLEASVNAYLVEGRLTIGLYGKNLLNEVTFSADTPLPSTPAFGGTGASFSPLNKGRVIGALAQYRF